MNSYLMYSSPLDYEADKRASEAAKPEPRESPRERMETRCGVDRTEVFRRRRDVFKPQDRR